MALCERDAPCHSSKHHQLGGFQATQAVTKKQSTPPPLKPLGRLGSRKVGGSQGAQKVTRPAHLWPLEQLELDLKAEK